jgi:hypothetical protein
MCVTLYSGASTHVGMESDRTVHTVLSPGRPEGEIAEPLPVGALPHAQRC